MYQIYIRERVIFFCFGVNSWTYFLCLSYLFALTFCLFFSLPLPVYQPNYCDFNLIFSAPSYLWIKSATSIETRLKTLRQTPIPTQENYVDDLAERFFFFHVCVLYARMEWLFKCLSIYKRDTHKNNNAMGLYCDQPIHMCCSHNYLVNGITWMAVQKGSNENALLVILQFACGLYKVMLFFGIAFSFSETTQSNSYSTRVARIRRLTNQYSFESQACGV